jgi:primosomal protein N' (replication factor Y)
VRTVRDGAEERWFVCPVSGARERAADVCPECGSWRLRQRGIGIQHVHDELAKELPGVPLIVFDHTTANTYKKASFLCRKFYETKGAVMIGTQMALSYLAESVDQSVVVSQDALRATPTWRREELTLSVLLQLRERTKGTVYVQVRGNADDDSKDDLIEYARSGALERFYNEEIPLRQQFDYPPFAHFVHLTWQGSAETVRKIEEAVRETLADMPFQYYGAPPAHAEAQVRYGLLRVAPAKWPDKSAVEALRRLPPSVRIVMNPDRIV